MNAILIQQLFTGVILSPTCLDLPCLSEVFRKNATSYTSSANCKLRAFASTILQKCQGRKKILILLKVLIEITQILLETDFHKKTQKPMAVSRLKSNGLKALLTSYCLGNILVQNCSLTKAKCFYFLVPKDSSDKMFFEIST